MAGHWHHAYPRGCGTLAGTADDADVAINPCSHRTDIDSTNDVAGTVCCINPIIAFIPIAPAILSTKSDNIIALTSGHSIAKKAPLIDTGVSSVSKVMAPMNR
jgi:hypothetical protein